MIEILEMKKDKEMQQVEMENKDSRVFIFRDGKDLLGSLHFISMHPHFMKMTKLELSEPTNLAYDLIVDGLLRTACHTFHTEKMYGIIVEEEKCREHNLKDIYFTPMAEIWDEISSEFKPDFMSDKGQYCLIKTDMIYKGCCKGV